MGIGAGLVFIGVIAAIVFGVRSLLPGLRKTLLFYGAGTVGRLEIRGEHHPLWAVEECASASDFQARAKGATVLMYDARTAKVRVTSNGALEIFATVLLGSTARSGRAFALEERDFALPRDFARFKTRLLGPAA